MDDSAIHGRRGREPISCANRQGSDGGLDALACGELLHFQRRNYLFDKPKLATHSGASAARRAAHRQGLGFKSDHRITRRYSALGRMGCLCNFAQTRIEAPPPSKRGRHASRSAMQAMPENRQNRQNVMFLLEMLEIWGKSGAGTCAEEN
jgi:hypothetical protein